METKPAVQQPGGPPATQLSPAILEAALVGGDLTGLSPTQRLQLISAVAERVGVDPLLRPFIYIRTRDNKLRLYPTAECAQQLRTRYEPSLTIVGRETIGDIYVVTARARLAIRDKHGLNWGEHHYREDESTGCVCITGLKGEDLANAFMKAETKAKRRVTLSIIGMGQLADVEGEGIGDAENGDGTPPALTGPALEPEHPPQAEPVATPKAQAAKPAISQQTQAYMERWQVLVTRAKSLGLDVPLLPWPCEAEVIAAAGLVLSKRIKVVEEGEPVQPPSPEPPSEVY